MYYGYYPYPHQNYGYYAAPYMQPVYPTYEETVEALPFHEDELERQGDQGNRPYVVNIKNAAERNQAFRRAIWTGRYMQLTLMRLMPGEDIGLEMHPHTDQFIRIEHGHGIVQMGDRRNHLNDERRIRENDAVLIPAGKWHNVRNTGRTPLLLYSIYAPPEHPKGTVHRTKQEAMHHHHGHHHHYREEV